MTEDELDEAARILADARRQHRQIEPPSWLLADHDQIYQVQDRVAARLAAPVAGWKVGARSRDVVPTCAPLLQPVQNSPTTIDPATMHLLGIESEIAFLVARDVPVSAAPITPHQALEAIGTAHPAIEVCDSRLIDFKSADPSWVLADNQSNHCLVVGPAWLGWRGHDWNAQPVRLSVDGTVIEDKRGGLLIGDPLHVVAWMVDHAARRRGGLRAGQFITTGSWTGLRFTHAGADVVVAFEGIGAARVTFAR